MGETSARPPRYGRKMIETYPSQAALAQSQRVDAQQPAPCAQPPPRERNGRDWLVAGMVAVRNIAAVQHCRAVCRTAANTGLEQLPFGIPAYSTVFASKNRSAA